MNLNKFKLKNYTIMLFIFFLFAIYISFIIHRAKERYSTYLKNTNKQIEIVSKIGVKLVEDYLKERLSDAKLIQENSFFKEDIFKHLTAEDNNEIIINELLKYVKNYGYETIYLVNKNGEELLRAPVVKSTLSRDLNSEIINSIESKKIEISEFNIDALTQEKYMAIIIPLLNNEKEKYAIILKVAYSAYIDKVINEWPIPNQIAFNKVEEKNRFLQEKKELNFFSNNIRNQELVFIQPIHNTNLVIAYNINLENDFKLFKADLIRSFTTIILILLLLIISNITYYLFRQKKIVLDKIKQEQEAREKDLLYQSLIINIEEKIFYKDTKSVYISCNESYAKDLGIQREQISGKNDFDFHTMELAKKYRSDDKKVIESKEKLEFIESYFLNGEERVILTVKTPIIDEKGDVKGILGVFNDITEKNRVEKELKESREVLKEILYSNPSAMIMVNIKNDIIEYINPAFSKITGYLHEDIEKNNINSSSIWLYSGEKERVFEEINKVGEKLNYETVLQKKSGEILFAIVSGKKIAIKENSFILWTIIDMSEIKKIEKALQESERRLKKAEIIAGAGNWRYNIKTNQITISEGCSLIYGLAPEHVDVDTINSVFKKEDLAFLKEKVEQAISTGEKIIAEFKITRISDRKEKIISLTAEYEHSQNSIFGIVIDITETKAKDLMLTESKNQLAELLFEMEDGVHIINANTKETITINNGMEKIFGINSNEFFTNSEIYFKTILDEDKEAIANIYQIIEEKKYIEISYRIKVGKNIKWIIQKSRAVFNDNEGIIRIDSIFIDFTKEKMIEEELIKAKEIAQESEQVKSTFLANMSHEIRTPMNGIVGMIELIKTTALNQEQINYVDTIENSATNLLQIINDILDISKIESGKMEAEYLREDIRKFITETTTILSNSALRKGLDFSVKIESDVYGEFETDFPRVRQVLTNLISNAIKFTDNGLVSLNVNILKEKENKVWIEFIISDTGIGISEEVKDILFRPFEQGDLSYTKKYQGTGLGLAICKKIVELLHGEIGFTSKKGEGSRFYFNIPMVRV